MTQTGVRTNIFGIGEVYELQREGQWVERNRESYREYGYFLGIGAPLNRLDYSNDTTTTNRRVANINQYYSGGVGNSNFGYIMGGNKSGFDNITDIKRIDYSNDTNILSRGGLTIGRSFPGATGNSNFGYIAGGNPSSLGYTSTTERINYSNDNTTASIRGPLTIARGVLGTGNSNFGYFGGGFAPGGIPVSTVDRIDYSNDSATALSRGNIQNSNVSFSATGNNNFGYFLTGWGTSSSHRLNYANDTALLSIRGSLSFPKFWFPGSAGNSNFGYSVGGSTNSSQAQAVSIVDRIDYSNDLVVASVRGPLSNVDLIIAATSSASFGGSPVSYLGAPWTSTAPFGYFGGGASPSVVSTVDRVSYTDDTTTALIRGPLTLSRSNLASAGNSNFGYFIGGLIPGTPAATTVSTVDRLDYSNDSNTASTRGNLLVADSDFAATGTSTFAYIAGSRGGTSTTLYRIDYTNDFVNVTARGTLSGARRYNATVTSPNFGYFSGNSTVVQSLVDRLDYSTDTTTTTVRGPLSQARFSLSGTSTDNFGYYGGGSTPSIVSRVDRVDFATDTNTASIRGPLSSVRTQAGSTGSSSFGYFAGGSVPGLVSSVNRVDYSNDTQVASVRGTTLTTSRNLSGGVSSQAYGGAPNTSIDPLPAYIRNATKWIDSNTLDLPFKRVLGSYGYFANGGIGGNVFLTRVDRIDFSNDTTTASQRGPTVALRIASQATGNTNYGYVSAGYPYSDALTVERIDYSNDSAITSRRGNLTQFHYTGCSLGLGNNNFGYFAGGSGPAFFSTVDRIDYSNDSATASARGPLIAARLDINGAGVGNANFGYIGGGNVPSLTPSLVSSVERITYANDLSKTSIRGPLTRADAYLFATGNSNFGYYFGGGGAPASYNGSSLSIRIDYSNDTATASSRQNLIVSPGKGSATGTSQYGYIVSGFSTAVLRLDYSSDTINSIRGPLSASRYLLGSTTNARSS
jgi:hypothetical protein